MKKLLDALNLEIQKEILELDIGKVNEEYCRGKICAYEKVRDLVEEEAKRTLDIQCDIQNLTEQLDLLCKENARMKKLLEAINVLTRGE